ncbi:hypothetical protein B0H10DRAFT_2233138 [Mycena sp. CBHHK59/15]|nr:hypothetical protein B0H10DRAFT_2233138 [Mycena sp. CBHHK59/15]
MAVPARCIQATSVAVSFLTSGATGYCLWLLTFPNMSSNSCHALILYKAPYAPEIVKPLGRGKVPCMQESAGISLAMPILGSHGALWSCPMTSAASTSKIISLANMNLSYACRNQTSSLTSTTTWREHADFTAVYAPKVELPSWPTWIQRLPLIPRLALIDHWTLDHWAGVASLQVYSGPDWPPFVICPQGPLNPAGWKSAGGWSNTALE